MEIDTINVEKLRLAICFIFVSQAVKIVEDEAVIASYVDLTKMKVMLTEFETAIKTSTGFSQTAMIVELDKKRDVIHSAIWHKLMANSKFPGANQIVASELLKLFKEYGTEALRRASYVEETGLIDSLYARLTNAENSPKVAQVSDLQDWFDALKAKNDALKSVMAEKIEDISADDKTAGEIRSKIADEYQNLKKTLESHSFLKTDPVFDSVITDINSMIAAYKV